MWSIGTSDPMATLIQYTGAGVCCCLTIACALTLSQAQTPVGIPTGLTPSKEPAPVQQTEEATIAELGEKRSKAEAELNTVKANAVSHVSLKEHERRSLLEQVVRGYDEQLDNYQRLKEAGQRLADVARSSADWKGFAESPPYSIFLVDQLWDSTYSLRLAVEGLQSQLRLIELRFERASEALNVANGRLRQASEGLESTTDPSKTERQRDIRDLEELRSRASAVTVAAAKISKKRVEAELAETHASLKFAERQLETAEQQMGFGEVEMEKVRKRLSEERQALENELDKAIMEQRAQSQALQASVQQEAQLAKQLSSLTSKHARERLTRSKMTVELKRAELDNSSIRGDLLQQLLDVVEGERQLWESRFSSAHETDPSQPREAYAKLASSFSNFRAFRDHLRQQLVATSGRMSELDNRVLNATHAEDRRLLQSMLHIYRQREGAYNRTLQRMDDASRFLERWKSEFKEQRRELPVSAKLDDWLQQVWGLVKQGWNFEVFTAEDTIEVEGKKITGQRSVTLGKIVKALAILLVGYWGCVYLAKLMGRLAVTRFGLSAGVANLIRQWSQACLLTVLIVVSLVSVKIPLTIFAFLGGAFAIGVGFGAQNLLKNVISGILILIERPLRVGDLIEVDNVRGRVTTIGLRSSTVLDAKGMETLVPNSSFLERHLTNWTYSSQHSRFSLRIGAPYGSSTQGIIDALAEVARDHPQVLKAPRPQVLLEDFGTQARIFILNYWLEIRLDVDPNQVASDLRFASEENLAKAGIKILPAA